MPHGFTSHRGLQKKREGKELKNAHKINMDGTLQRRHHRYDPL
jgi:hypothetical protein